MKVQILLCSKNSYFLDCFSSYVMGKREINFEISFLSEFNSVIPCISTKKIEVCIADKECLDEIELPKGVVGIVISDRTKIKIEEFYSELNIYQKGMDILNDIQTILSTLHRKNISETQNRKTIISFSSVQGGSGKTTLAYLCAMLCAKEMTSLYCNMEEFSYTKHLYQVDFETKMEDIIFALKDKRDISVSIVNMIKRNKDSVLVIPTIQNFSDLQSMSSENIVNFIQSLKDNTEAEMIFLDIPSGFYEKNEKIFELCDYNFVVFADDVVGNGKLECLKNDESMKEKTYYDDLFFIINKSRKKKEDSKTFYVPFSESLFQGVGLEQVAFGNQDFSHSCKEILKFIRR